MYRTLALYVTSLAITAPANLNGAQRARLNAVHDAFVALGTTIFDNTPEGPIREAIAGDLQMNWLRAQNFICTAEVAHGTGG